MYKLALAACLLLISCSRIIVDINNVSAPDKVSSLPTNTAFKTKSFNGTIIYFSPVDLSLLDNRSDCIDLRNNLKISFDQEWYNYMHGTTKDNFTMTQSNDVTYIATIKIEQIRTQSPLKLLNPLRKPGKIVTYTVRVIDKKNGELCFGMKGEWTYFSTGNLAVLAVDIAGKMI